MKTTLLVLLVLCAVGAFGQVSATVSSQPVPAVFADHPLHAGPHAMATETPVAGGAADTYGYAQGEQPLWQFGPASEAVPLGDIARAYRRERMTGKKAEIVLEKQGS